MNEKTLKTLGIVTLVAIVLAVAIPALRDRGTTAGSTDERMLPALEDRANDVRTVLVESARETFTFAGSGGDWRLEEKAGYPARSENVRSLVLALRDARLLEEKTSKPERFERLGLQAPDVDGSPATRVTLKDEGGETISSVLIGKRRFTRPAEQPLESGRTPEEQYYVHPNEDGPTYLALGALRVNSVLSQWIDQQVTDLGRDRIAAVRVAHPDGEVLEAARREMTDGEMVVLDVPDGSVQKESGTQPMLNAVGGLRLDDVKKAGDVDWDGAEVTTAEFFTEDGLRVTVESIELPREDAPASNVVWARVRADVAPDAAPSLPEPPADDEMGPPAPEDGDGAPEESDSDDAPDLDALRSEADAINARTDGWIYAIPGWKANGLRMRTETLVESAPEPEPEPEVAEDAAAPAEDAGGGADPESGAADGAPGGGGGL